MEDDVLVAVQTSPSTGLFLPLLFILSTEAIEWYVHWGWETDLKLWSIISGYPFSPQFSEKKSPCHPSFLTLGGSSWVVGSTCCVLSRRHFKTVECFCSVALSQMDTRAAAMGRSFKLALMFEWTHLAWLRERHYLQLSFLMAAPPVGRVLLMRSSLGQKRGLIWSEWVIGLPSSRLIACPLRYGVRPRFPGGAEGTEISHALMPLWRERKEGDGSKEDGSLQLFPFQTEPLHPAVWSWLVTFIIP